MNFNKITKKFIGVFIIIIIGIFINKIVIRPVEVEINNLENKKVKTITNEQKKEIKYKKENDDLVLKIENEFSKFIDVLYVNKFLEWDENNNEFINIELKVSGSIEELLKLNDEIKKIKGNNSIQNIQINKKNTNNVEIKDEIKVDIIECIMTLRVG
ncbi:hypothetical protein QOZ84_08490 [Romboutsia sedimentorum]|uniref:SpoIIIAH-like family protein n=1 Tax=Romboutsia sedimentorum TaxID=1368474 RepID=A0ABT7ECC8_9FIRM|nr:hypothetical protein [Romboutsia sedimentorum]MDK2563586.1 hypothetical protein [Romboutsia sedimentorum]